MINLETGNLSVDCRAWHKITEWTVWFQTPFGVCHNLAEAAKLCKQKDLDPEFVIIPVPVAITDNGDAEIIRR